jgi:hypothetical protein
MGGGGGGGDGSAAGSNGFGNVSSEDVDDDPQFCGRSDAVFDPQSSG